MTREEIIGGLKFTVEMFLFDPITGETFTEPRNDMDKTTIDACRGAIELLEQEFKTGHWIEHYGYDFKGDYAKEYSCSECNEYVNDKSKFCPNCGADMRADSNANSTH